MNSDYKHNYIEIQDFDVSIPTIDGKSIAEWKTIQIPMEWDAEIKEWLMTPEGSRLVEDTKARHMGLLLPEEMMALRNRLGLTQKEIGELLQIGEKTWTRWERGRARPSRSVNLLLRALNEREITIDFLNRMKQQKPSWDKVVSFMDRKPEPFRMDALMCKEPQSVPYLAKQKVS